MKCDGNGKVIPSVTCIKETIVVVFSLAREKEEQPTFYLVDHFLQDKGDFRKSIERSDPGDSDHGISIDVSGSGGVTQLPGRIANKFIVEL
jgi:hypothetical protein